MDAEFLKLTVNDALLEALTATAIANPDDKIDYLGNYLVQYVNRIKKKRAADAEALISKQNADIVNAMEKEKQDIVDYVNNNEAARNAECDAVIESIFQSAANKQIAMDMFCNTCQNYLSVPAVYIGYKTKIDETDCLNYISANNTQTFMIGKQILKVEDDSDEKPERLGVSFNVFNIPEGEEEEEEEEPEEDEDGNPIPKKEKVPFKLPPLLIENVMRNKDVKFFGIPKIGSVAILPFSYESSDHDTGCNVEIELPKSAEEGEDEVAEAEGDEVDDDGNPIPKKEAVIVAKPEPITKYTQIKIKKEFIIVADTIGDYKILKVSFIYIVYQIYLKFTIIIIAII